MKKFLILTVLMLSCVSFAAAQSDEYRKNEFFAGYSYNRFVDDEDAGEHGFNAAYTYNFNRYVGAKADVSGHFRRDSETFFGTTINSRSDVYRYMGGIQFKDNSHEGRVKPFAHVLAGGASLRSSSSFGSSSFSDTTTGFALAVGGGLDIKASKRISVRVAQVDYAPIFVNGGTGHAVRVGAGIVFH